jgi:hypothetical protein
LPEKWKNMPDHLLSTDTISALAQPNRVIMAPSTLVARNSQCFVVQSDRATFYVGAECGYTDSPALPLEQ